MMEAISPQIESSWKSVLEDEFRSPYFAELKKFLVKERSQHTVYPQGSQLFNAFDKTPFSQVKVVILGQDPYHGPGQAHGLSFSVPDGVPFPPSLRNIFKEIQADTGAGIPLSGNLEIWAQQGVLLLNATLSVRANQAGSHQKQGWETFTDNVIRRLSEQREHLVFMLWGRYARNKVALIDRSKHCVLEAAHPSPLSAYNGFFGCRHFSKANEYLFQHGISPIQW